MGTRRLTRTATRVPTHMRRNVRYVTAGLAGATALLYLLVGTEVLPAVEPAPEGDGSLLSFGLAAGGAFLLGAALLLAFDRRFLWILGAGFQVATIVMYFAVAPERTPAIEPWGLLIKALQVLILTGLVYLALTPARGEESPRVPASAQ